MFCFALRGRTVTNQRKLHISCTFLCRVLVQKVHGSSVTFCPEIKRLCVKQTLLGGGRKRIPPRDQPFWEVI